SVIHPGQVIALTAPAAAPSAAPAAPAAPAAAAIHTVVGGDTLWAIARSGGISLAALLDANALDASSIIYPGQQLVIPASAPALELAAATAPAAAAATPSPAAPVVLDAEQSANARIIIEVGRSRGVSDRGIAIALATAMVESWIRNLDWGDRDSLGLFQQRPSTGWGTEAEVRDPYRAAAAFYGGPGDPNGTTTRGLLDVAGWESMGFGEAAQAVQVSAYPDRYAPWEQQAYAWLAALG
ncbi:MAG TPA: LysM domain-containing protein, partial [Microbacterium sp.]|nr:LysM domain-containing protein [Microbacterium sp.]